MHFDESIKTEANMKSAKINPFLHRYKLNSKYDYVKLFFMSIFVLPIKIILLCIVLITGYIVSSVGLWQVSKEELNMKPFTGWRILCRWFMGLLGRCMLRIYGFQWIKIKGKLESRKEAPIIVVGPHSSFMDAIAVFWSDMPGLVNRIENLDIPFFGKYINFTQPVYVQRGDPKCRSTTIQKIVTRANSDDDWPQIMIFPEGTCTNRSSLITFKPGAFYPGVPVQPLIIRYPNASDCFTWTWDGPGVIKIIWATLCQFHNYCELEYLPVYHPNEEEIKDPELFASNVRQLMSNALGIPVIDYTYDDCRLMHKAKLKKLPCSIGLIGIQNLRRTLGLSMKRVEEEILDHFAAIANKDGIIRIEDLSNYLGIPVTEAVLLQLFNLYDRNGSGKVEFKDYLIIYSDHIMKSNTEEVFLNAFSSFDKENRGYATCDDFVAVLKSALGLADEYSMKIFKDADNNRRGRLNHDDFVNHAKRKPEYAYMFVSYKQSIKDDSRSNISSASKPKSD